MAQRGPKTDSLRFGNDRRDGRGSGSFDRREDKYRPRGPGAGRRDRSRSPRDRHYDRSDRRNGDRARRDGGPVGRDREYVRDRDRESDRNRAPRDSRPRDDYREHRRRDPSTERRSGRDSWDARTSHNGSGRNSREPTKEQSQTPVPTKPSDDDVKKQERLAKIAAWKADKLGKTTGNDNAESPPQAASHEATDKKPASKKFDPKTILDKAASNKNARASKLDEGLPKTLTVPQVKVDPSKPISGSTRPLKESGNVSAFGLKGKAQAASDQSATKKSLFEDEEIALKRTFEKLPDFTADDQLLPDDQDEEDVGGMSDDGSDNEEVVAARRAAAEKRREDAQANGDVDMADVLNAPADVVMSGTHDEEDEVDPLDAFMNGLEAEAPAPKKSTQTAEALYNDDDEVVMEATEGTADEFATVKRRKVKEAPVIDHSKVAYEPFRKAFYTEPADLKDMTDEELADLRLELDGIKVKGTNVPKPVVTWPRMSLSLATLSVLKDLGYEKPTAIQCQAIPTIESGRDVISVAKTGSGKTLAFGLPILRHIQDQRELGPSDGPIVLILAPTRELVVQIARELKPFLKAHALKALSCVGGNPISDDIASVKRGGFQVLVATAGRLIDLMRSNSGRVLSLKRVTYLVLDEADRMFDMGFEPQVNKIVQSVRPDRQTVLFSATFPPSMERLAKKSLDKPVEIVVGGRSTVAPEVTQIVEVIKAEDKFRQVLLHLGQVTNVDDNAKVLIFVKDHQTADTLWNDIQAKGYPARSCHGGKEQVDREDALREFKAGIIPVLVATSVAARGLDVKQLNLVINYDAPNHLEDYIHRVGRTGRAGNKGTAITFIQDNQEIEALHVAKALAYSGVPIPEDLKKLVDSCTKKVDSGEIKLHQGGFGGRGLDRIVAQRENEKMREKRAYQVGDEGAENDEVETQESIVVTGSSNATRPKDSSAPAGLPDLNAEIVVFKTAQPDAGNKLDAVNSAVGRINERLTRRAVIHPGQPIDNKGPDAGAFHSLLEINDFPQKARWSVTNRTNVAKILERTGTSITTKGIYYPENKGPEKDTDQPKLYILVEGDTEAVVKGAMRELQTLMREAQASADNEPRAMGKYNPGI